MKVTLDTNVLDESGVKRIEAVAEGLPIDFYHITVSERELEGWVGSSFVSPFTSIPETAVWGEAQWGRAVWGAANSQDIMDRILKIIASGSVPTQRQLRDAMILLDHVRVRNDILVSNDAKAYIGKGGDRRRQLEELCDTRIMTVDEFNDYCDGLR